MDDLVKIAREGFCGDKCRVMKADLGCTCSALADRIESLTAEISAKQRIIDAQAAIIAEMQERLRAETTELRMQMLSDQGQHIEETGNLLSALREIALNASHGSAAHAIAMSALNWSVVNTPGGGDKTMGDS